MIVDIITAILMVIGSALVCIAGLGLLRMPDLIIRMHASTKAGTLGAGLVLAAVGIHFVDVAVASRAVAAILFLLLTAPVAAHMIGRAAYRTDLKLWERNIMDELRESETLRRREAEVQAQNARDAGSTSSSSAP
ncbi:monovalent cation/H(+) antiporter subunit G [Telmatospirillum sp. J64-1]|uniref:monovalent cation/H(+) antiporter subunit G n=1 Tax=Telmatospirillum sp. J64-1 TaxID=2502183 RepID=UPI00115E2C3A|nr:monovalent cation/H(+) antiporter subunit G [Telmatospirillum sp. J64-1]